MIKNLELSNYVTLVVTVQEEYADVIRRIMGEAGAGKIGNYSFCSFSVKGTGRFLPNEKSNPTIGTQNILETITEERIETVCELSILEHVLAEIKKAHPYETTMIDIYPVYKIGLKLAKTK